MLIIYLPYIFIESNKLPSQASIYHACLDSPHKVQKFSSICFFCVSSGLTSSFFNVGDPTSSRYCRQGVSNAIFNGTNISSFTVLLENSLLKHCRVTFTLLWPHHMGYWVILEFKTTHIILLCCFYTKSSQSTVVFPMISELILLVNFTLFHYFIFSVPLIMSFSLYELQHFLPWCYFQSCARDWFQEHGLQYFMVTNVNNGSWWTALVTSFQPTIPPFSPTQFRSLFVTFSSLVWQDPESATALKWGRHDLVANCPKKFTKFWTQKISFN